MNTLKRKAAIIGCGETIGKFSDRSLIELAAEAAVLAIKDARIEKKDIDGLLIKHETMIPTGAILNEAFCDYLQLRTNYSSCVQSGGATHASMAMFAAAAINAGLCHTVLCVASGKFPQGVSDEYIMSAASHEEWEMPWGTFIPALNALAATRHMYEYGTTSEQLARVSVAARKWALKHPKAVMRDKGEITVEDVLNSKMVAYPLHMLDCSVPQEGAGAYIVAEAERAKEVCHTPVYILGAGECLTHGWVSQAPSFTLSGCEMAAQRAYKMAGVTPKDIDFAQVYDAFTFHTIFFMEECGFCKKGEGGKFVEEGHIEPEGDLPVNTFGGLLSFGHKGSGAGMSHVIEAITQLMGKAGERQVKNAEIGLAHCFGGMLANHSVLILGR